MASSDRNKHLRAGRGMLGEHAADSSRSPREEILRVPYGNLRDVVTRSFAWAIVLARQMPDVAIGQTRMYLTDSGLQLRADELAPRVRACFLELDSARTQDERPSKRQIREGGRCCHVG